MSAGLLLTLIFGAFYPAVAVAVWCIGAFSIGTTTSDRKAGALRRAKQRYPSLYRDSTEAVDGYVWATVGVIAIALFAGALWPLAIPLWFAFRKGRLVDRTLIDRDLRAELDQVRSELDALKRQRRSYPAERAS